MTTEDGKFNFTPARQKGKYCVVRIYCNPLKLDSDLPLKDITKNLNPLPSCHSTKKDYLQQFQQQYNFVISRLNEIYNANPDSFVRFDKKKNKNTIDTKMLTALVYGNKARSKSRNQMVFLPVRKQVAGKELRNFDGISIVDTELKTVNYVEVEKEKINEADKINRYFGIKSTPETILDELKNRNKWDNWKERAIELQKKYGDFSLITDPKKINEILSEGDFDQSDLYLYCCAIANKERNASKFTAILHRFREYNLRNNTTLRLKDLTFDGIKKFVLFFVDNGIIDFSTQGMTPFNYRQGKFKERMNSGTALIPTDETWRKFYIYLKLLLRLLNKDGALKTGWNKEGVLRLDEINELGNEENYGITYSSLSSNTRQNYFLTKDEFDNIFKLKLKDALEEKKHPITGRTYTLGYTKEELTLTRDMFVCMAWFGGLRPIEYRPEKISVLQNAKGEYYVNFITSDKNKKEVANPILNYAYDTLKKYGFKIPYVKLDSLEFKKRLQEILKQAKIDREIDKIESRAGEHKKTKVNIQDAIYPYFARHTFIQILTDEGLHENQIVRYTGQAFPNVSIEAYSSKGMKIKTDWIKHIKAK